MKECFLEKIVLLFLLLAVLSGCSLIEGRAGQAHYTMEPVVVGDQVICCKVDIFNAKDIGKITATAHKLDDGSYEIILSEEGVNSSAPMEIMANQQKEMMQLLMQMVLTAPVPGI